MHPPIFFAYFWQFLKFSLWQSGNPAAIVTHFSLDKKWAVSAIARLVKPLVIYLELLGKKSFLYNWQFNSTSLKVVCNSWENWNSESRAKQTFGKEQFNLAINFRCGMKFISPHISHSLVILRGFDLNREFLQVAIEDKIWPLYELLSFFFIGHIMV